MRLVQMRRDLALRHVRRRFDQRQDLLAMGLDPMRSLVATLGLGPHITRPLPLIGPIDRRRGCDTEPRRSATS